MGDSMMTDAWYFWNHTYYNKTKPSRKIKPVMKGCPVGRREMICNDCGKNITIQDAIRKTAILDFGRYPNTKNTSYLCKRCYYIRKENLRKKKEKELSCHREEKVKQFMVSIERFDDLMIDCEFNTCDILAAHHELLKDDDNRLTSEFMLGLICGEEKKKKYLEKRKNRET